MEGVVSGGGQGCPWDGRSLCEFLCLHLDRAWTGPTSLTGWQACLRANLGQLRWGLWWQRWRWRGAGRVGIRKVSRFDKGGQDSQVSESEPLSAPLPNALSSFSPCRLLPRHFPYNLSPNGTTKTCQSSSQAHNEWIHVFFLFRLGFLFSYFLQTFIRALTNCPVARSRFWVLFTTSAAVIQSDSQTFFHSWKCQVIIGTLGGEIQC